MTRTTAEWEALLDGTTPGPWEPHPEFPNCLTNESENFAVAVFLEKEPEDTANKKLVAATPDAVAEVIRLQNALQGLADWHDIKAMKARTYPAPGRESEGERAARVHETARDKITAILNGDPDEH